MVDKCVPNCKHTIIYIKQYLDTEIALILEYLINIFLKKNWHLTCIQKFLILFLHKNSVLINL